MTKLSAYILLQDALLCKRKLWVWDIAGDKEPGAIQQETRHWYLVGISVTLYFEYCLLSLHVRHILELLRFQIYIFYQNLCMILFTYRYYAKRCFLSLIENLGKHMITVKDSVIQECIQFLEHCEGKRKRFLYHNYHTLFFKINHIVYVKWFMMDNNMTIIIYHMSPTLTFQTRH